MAAADGSASMTAIAAAAGVTKPILYRHFTDRSDLLGALAERHVSRLRQQVMDAVAQAETPHDRIRVALDAYLAFAQSDPRVYRFLTEEPGDDEDATRVTVSRFLHDMGTEVGGLVAADLSRAGRSTAPAQAWGHAIVGAAQGVSTWWLATTDATREEVLDALVGLLWAGLARGAEPVADRGTDH